jgi:hypothetical protein
MTICVYAFFLNFAGTCVILLCPDFLCVRAGSNQIDEWK